MDIAASVCLPHAHGGGRADAERHHVRGGDHVHGDTVGGERSLVETRHHDGDDREYRAFEENLAGGGQAELNQSPDARHIRPPGDVEQEIAGAAFVPYHHNRQQTGQISARERGGQRRSRDSQGGRSPVSIHQHPIAAGVHDVSAHQRESHRLDDVHRL